MKAIDIEKIIEQEINGNDSLTNLHGVDLNRSLVTPIKQIYQDSFNQGETIELWLVLVEIPAERSGYKIVFDEQSQMFGLAIKGAQEYDVFIGFYGTFLETLKAM